VRGGKKPRNRHHLVPKRRGGSKHKSNMLLIDVIIHRYWHKLFGLRTLEEVIALLIGGRRRWRNHRHLIPKRRRRSKYKSRILIDILVQRYWYKVFGNRTQEEVIALLIRVQRAKANQKDNKWRSK
jgi:hypothetical protein